jgi:hypothetical protein
MTEPRRKLSVRLDPKPNEDETATLLAQAMDHHLCVRWTYNRTLMQAAPQILYHRNGSLHCDAIVTEREGMSLAEPKLGTFKLAGLGRVALTSEPFELASIDPNDARYVEGIVGRAGD